MENKYRILELTFPAIKNGSKSLTYYKIQKKTVFLFFFCRWVYLDFYEEVGGNAIFSLEACETHVKRLKERDDLVSNRAIKRYIY